MIEHILYNARTHTVVMRDASLDVVQEHHDAMLDVDKEMSWELELNTENGVLSFWPSCWTGGESPHCAVPLGDDSVPQAWPALRREISRIFGV